MNKLTLICFLFFILNITQAEETISDDSSMRYIQYSYTLQNKSNSLIKKCDFWSYAPLKQTFNQSCLKIEASFPFKVISDNLGNQILHFELRNIAPYDSIIISINAQVLLSKKLMSEPETNENPFLRPEKYIESDNIEIIKLANEFSSPNKLETIENIFYWVADNIQYSGYIKNPRGAFYTLKTKKGDCTEYMYLFIALCRANNISARGMGGYICKENMILTPNEFHNWAEFFYDGKWEIADPQEKVLMPDQSNYIAMSIIGESNDRINTNFERFYCDDERIKVTISD